MSHDYKRTETIALLQSIAKDMRHASVLLQEFSPDNADQLNGAAGMIDDWIEHLREGE